MADSKGEGAIVGEKRQKKKRHHFPEVGESHPTRDTFHLSAFEGGNPDSVPPSSSPSPLRYLVRNDLKIVINEEEEVQAEATLTKHPDETRADQMAYEGAKSYVRVRDGQLKEIARIFRHEDWADLSDDQLVIKKYTGGLSNKLYRCSSLVDPRQKVLIRVIGSTTQEDGDEVSLADRDSELLVFQAAYEAGLGPKFYGKYRNGCVYGHVDGKTLTVDDIHKSEYAALIARRIAQWHAKIEIPGIPKEPTWTTLVRKWLELVPSDLSHIDREDQKDEWKALGVDVTKEMEELDTMLRSVNSPVVFCHNDVQPMNCIYDEETNSVGLIDFEYACYNHRGFDLGNHFSEHMGFELDWSKYPSREKQFFFLTKYLEAYLDRSPTEWEVDEAYVEANKYTLASHLHWGIWGLAQAKISDIDYDFFAYALRRLTRYVRTKEALFAL